MGKFNINHIDQIGIVVRDVEEAAKRYWEDFGIGPWAFVELGPDVFQKMTLRGKEETHVVKAAMAQVGPLQIELMQPVSGKSPHQEFLDQYGEGLHHLGIFVDDLISAGDEMRQMGCQELMGAYGMGPTKKGGALYFDTMKSHATLIEIIEIPEELPAPCKFYPEQEE